MSFVKLVVNILPPLTFYSIFFTHTKIHNNGTLYAPPGIAQTVNFVKEIFAFFYR